VRFDLIFWEVNPHQTRSLWRKWRGANLGDYPS